MYKIISNGQVIDILNEIKYLRYLYKSKRIVVSDVMSANCIQGSDNKTIYGLRGNNFPSDFPHKIVIIKRIDKKEFDTLTLLMNKGEIIRTEDPFLITARKNKIAELKQECDNQIIAGICIKLSDEKFHSFELTIEDQLNLKSIENTLNKYNNGIIYHEKGKVCSVFTKDDMKTIITSATRHIQYHTTYFNLMKYCINNMNVVNDILDIHYGDEVPDINYQKLLSQI